MSVGVRLKKTVKTKLKFGVGRVKATGFSVKSVDRRKHESGRIAKGRSIDADHEPYERRRNRDTDSSSDVKGNRLRFNRERNGREVDAMGRFESETTDRRPRNRDTRSSSGVKGNNLHFNREWSGREVDARGRFESETTDRRPRNRDTRSSSGVKGNNLHFNREWSGREVDARGRFESEIPDRRPRNRDTRSSSGVKGNSLRFNREWSGREVDAKGRFDSETTDRRRKRVDATRYGAEERKYRGVRGPIRKSSSIDGKSLRKGVSFARKGSRSDVGLSNSNVRYVNRRDRSEDDSNEEKSSVRPPRVLRGHNGKIDAGPRVLRGQSRQKDAVGGSRNPHTCEDRAGSVEASADKFRSKGRRIDRTISTDRRKGDVVDGLMERHAKGKDRLNQIPEQRNDKHQSQLLHKSGKRITSQKRSSSDDSVVTDDPPKKKKRVIRIDPYDISNKRLDDGFSNKEKAVEKEIEISKNAQFRAIQPSPSILSFVEDNLLGRRRSIELRNAGYDIKLSAPLDNIPFSTCPERERIEENIFRNKLEFFAAAKISSSFPPPMIPEIAFAGRSNVGKSSLLNALTRQWGVVRTSDKPGYTQTINFFRLASKLSLVDLPGYGFAYAKEEVKDAWEELVKEYVSTRDGLKRVCLLIDTKWGMKPRDHELIDLMERSQTPYQIVLTKTDSIFPIDVARRAMQIQENLKANKSIVDPVMMVSSKSGAGIRSLRTVLAKIARFVKP